MKKVRKNKLFIYFIDEIIKLRLLKFLSDKQFIALEYFVMTRKFIKTKNPVTFTEKIQWLKLFGHLERFTKYVDKIEARKYVEQVLGKDYLIPLIGSWTNVDDIDFNALPDRFVFKATHGSAYIYICKDKSKFKVDEFKKLAKSWLNENFYLKTREMQYKGCTPRIICEPYIEEKSGRLTDYKIFCVDGVPKLIKVVWGRFDKHKVDVMMDLNWKKTDIALKGFKLSNAEIDKPANLDQLLAAAGKLAKPFPFVRVDLYSVDGHIYFGELTFTPANGVERYAPPYADKFLGELIDITKY